MSNKLDKNYTYLDIKEPTENVKINKLEKSLIDELVFEINNKCSQSNPTRLTLTIEQVDKIKLLPTNSQMKFSNILKYQTNHPDLLCPYINESSYYELFNEFFIALIQKVQNCNYHQNFSDCLLFGNSNYYRNVDLNNNKEILRVMYIEMIIRRNLYEYEFINSLTNDQLDTLKLYLKNKLKNIFVSLSPITLPNEWLNRTMLDDKVMNQNTKSRDSIVFRDDSDTTLGGLINYDDHLQLIISTNSGNIGQIYHQINEMINSKEFNEIHFLRNKKFGFLTVNPQFIGTGFTICIHLKLPFVSLLDDTNELYLKDLGLTLTPLLYKKDIMNLTNHRTISIKEEDIFKNIIEGYKLLHSLDLELGNCCKNSSYYDVMPVESLNKLVMKIFSNNYMTYTKKYLTETIVNLYNGVTTNFNGLLNHCIRGNAHYPNSLFPKACDPDCYSTFSYFFHPILFEANNIRQFLHHPSPIYKHAVGEIKFAFYHPTISAFRVRFARNLEDFPFPMLTSNSERKSIEDLLIKAFTYMPNDLQGRYIKLKDIENDKAYNFMKRHNLIPQPNNLVKKCNYVYRNWPVNRGIYLVNENFKYPGNVLLVLVNVDDHFQVISLNYLGKRIDLCYDRSVRLMRVMDKYFEFKFARKNGYGFLSSNPQNIGCCMRVSAHIRLENLGKDKKALDEFCKINSLNYRGLHGCGSPVLSDIFDVSLKLNMNNSEYQIFMLFTQRLKDMLIEERSYNYSLDKPLYPDKKELQGIQLQNENKFHVTTFTENTTLIEPRRARKSSSIQAPRIVKKSYIKGQIKSVEMNSMNNPKVDNSNMTSDLFSVQS